MQDDRDMLLDVGELPTKVADMGTPGVATLQTTPSRCLESNPQSDQLIFDGASAFGLRSPFQVWSRIGGGHHALGIENLLCPFLDGELLGWLLLLANKGENPIKKK
jgi:hypothetical protein